MRFTVIDNKRDGWFDTQEEAIDDAKKWASVNYGRSFVVVGVVAEVSPPPVTVTRFLPAGDDAAKESA